MEFNEMINTALYVVIIVVLPIVATFVVNLIKEKIKESAVIEEATKNKNVSNIVKDALLDVMDAVLYVNQVYTDSIKKSGKFDEEAQAEAFNLAYQAALTMISAETQKVIEQLYGSFDEWLRLKIEAAVNTAKQQ